MWAWLKDKWKIVAGALVAFVGLFSFLSRSRSSKRVLDAANKAQKKESEINDRAISQIKSGIEGIQKKKEESLEKASSKHKEAQETIAKQKEEFIKKSIDGDTLSKDIADHLGATHVETD